MNFDEMLPRLDATDRKINALSHSAKDLCRIQRDETGRNWLERDGIRA